jgi:hypothetical protein
MRDQIYFYGLCIAFAVIAIYFDLSYFGQGVLVGTGVAVAVTVGSEPPIELALVSCVIGLIFLAMAYYFATEYGMSFEMLDKTRSVGKFIRRLPYYAIAASTIGILLVAYYTLGKLSEKYD